MGGDIWRQIACWTPLVSVFAVTGCFVGWLIGASQTPVVATALPIVVGLLGALSYGLLESRIRAKRIAARCKDLNESVRQEIRSALGETSLAGPAFWALGVILFSIFGYIGVRSGVSRRVPTYPPMEEMVRSEKLESLEGREVSHLYMLRWHLQANGVQTNEVEALFLNSISPILELPSQDDRWQELTTTVHEIIDLNRKSSPVPVVQTDMSEYENYDRVPPANTSPDGSEATNVERSPAPLN